MTEQVVLLSYSSNHLFTEQIQGRIQKKKDTFNDDQKTCRYFILLIVFTIRCLT
jgi:hypothetical protein